MSLEQSSSGSGSLLDQTLNTTLQVSQPHISFNGANLNNKEMVIYCFLKIVGNIFLHFYLLHIAASHIQFEKTFG